MNIGFKGLPKEMTIGELVKIEEIYLDLTQSPQGKKFLPTDKIFQPQHPEDTPYAEKLVEDLK